MTTVVISPPIGPASSPPTVPTGTKTVVRSVAVETPSANDTKEASQATLDTAKSKIIDFVQNCQQHDVKSMESSVEKQDSEKSIENKDDGAVVVKQRLPQKRRKVLFECADIVEFEPTVYTTSITSGGIPIGLSLDERSRSRRRLDSFEMERVQERVGRQNYMEKGYLDPQEREVILTNAGCQAPVMASVEAEVNAIIYNRLESNVIDHDFLYGTTDLSVEDANIDEEDDGHSIAWRQQEDGEESNDSEQEQSDNTRSGLKRRRSLDEEPSE
ncbi:hypothetical protein CCR75_007604 [Bremia lactucae]|uniref:Uncharacterized protein n=1 Tax=Bremia lactucae TaxID=4779 RepID=A0A976IL74_BRELC|nr:hypothetical protein CCR75_007604 [Bremia lactucae]